MQLDLTYFVGIIIFCLILVRNQFNVFYGKQICVIVRCVQLYCLVELHLCFSAVQDTSICLGCVRSACTLLQYCVVSPSFCLKVTSNHLSDVCNIIIIQFL